MPPLHGSQHARPWCTKQHVFGASHGPGRVQAKLEEAGSAELSLGGETHTLQTDMVTIEKVTKSRSGHSYTPSVIEPSFGIGRIVYCIFEHTFYVRPDDAQKTVFRFSPQVAPMKTTVFPLLQRKELNDAATAVSLDLRRAGVSSIIDTTSAAPAYAGRASNIALHTAVAVVAAAKRFASTCKRALAAPQRLRMQASRSASATRAPTSLACLSR